MGVHLRNIETGAIKVLETVSSEFHSLVLERTKDGRFPLWEQTGAHDADPQGDEARARSKFDAPLSDVTADGVGQSAETEAKLAAERSEPEVDAPASDPAAAAPAPE